MWGMKSAGEDTSPKKKFPKVPLVLAHFVDYMFYHEMDPQKIRALLNFAKASENSHLKCKDVVNVLLKYKQEDLAE